MSQNTGSAGLGPVAGMRTTGRAIKREPGTSQFSGTASVPHSAAYLALLPSGLNWQGFNPLSSPARAASGSMETGAAAKPQPARRRPAINTMGIRSELAFKIPVSFFRRAWLIFEASGSFGQRPQDLDLVSGGIDLMLAFWR